MIDRFIALIITWVALWGDFTVANVATGIVVAGALFFLFPTPDRVDHRINIVGMVKFLVRFFIDIVQSSFSVALAVLFPNEKRLKVKTVAVQLHTRDPFITTVICNAMTLTPGTMTVAIDDKTLVMHVHVLGDIDAATVQHEVHELEKRVLAALTARPKGGKRNDK